MGRAGRMSTTFREDHDDAPCCSVGTRGLLTARRPRRRRRRTDARHGRRRKIRSPAPQEKSWCCRTQSRSGSNSRN